MPINPGEDPKYKRGHSPLEELFGFPITITDGPLPGLSDQELFLREFKQMSEAMLGLTEAIEQLTRAFQQGKTWDELEELLLQNPLHETR